jgi:uncharacterized protein (DUF2141 family)
MLATFFLPFAFFLQLPAVAQRCALSGTVIDSVTDELLHKTRLRLERADGNNADAVVTQTAEDGRFCLHDLEEGTYRLQATRRGYLETYYGERRQGKGGTLIRLRDGEPLSAVVVKLVRGAVIAGTIRDAEGEPVERAHVVLGRFSYEYGRGRVEGMASTDTDDRGEYRFSGLAAGKYYVSAEPKSDGRVRMEGPPEGDVLTLYPAARDVSAAMPLVVTAGRQLLGMDIQLARARLYRVSGQVRNGVGSGPSTVLLRETRSAGMRDSDLSTSAPGKSGAFVFRSVPAGTYELEARQDNLAAKMTISVSADLDGLGITMVPRADILITFSVEAEEKPDLAGIHCFLTSDGRQGVAALWRGTNDLLARGVPAGSYSLIVEGSPLRKYFVKSATAGSEDVLERGIAVAGQEKLSIHVVLSASGGRLTGNVSDASRQPVAGALVLLGSRTVRGHGQFQTAMTDQQGRYEFTAVAPGEYWAIAWEDVEAEEWRDPIFLKGYEKQARAVVVREREESSLPLRAATVPDAP